ncbi:MAG: hypothetical protein KZQ57_02335, partial [gamma proteobacterium symbiont of Lucinoma myriamae]|nr:hypothetical protein [gamma proteobacterium symbiont of Lucinoma myriamae]
WLDTIYIAVILLQGTYTPLVYAHDGRTQLKSIEDHQAFTRWLKPLRQKEWVVYAKRPRLCENYSYFLAKTIPITY